jgi:uncharacterized protein (TIGR00369 family)
VDSGDVAQLMLQNMPHARDIGLEAISVGSDEVTLKLEMQDRFVGDPDTGVIHGGIITVALDTASGMAVLAKMVDYVPFATLDLRLDYLKPARPTQAIFAHAHCYRFTKSVAFTQGVAYQDNRNNPIANCVGTFMISSPGRALEPAS